MSKAAENRVSPGVLFPAALVVALVAWIYLPLSVAMADNWWQDPNYSHGFLVPLVSAWFLWRDREGLAKAASGPALGGFLVMAAGVSILTVGQLAHEFFLQRISLVPVLWGLAVMAWGWRLGWRSLFPALYLILMIPLPYVLYDSVAFPLRLAAASLAGSVIELAGTPAVVEGNMIHLPSVVLDVVDACSGIRSLVSLLAAGLLMAQLMLRQRWLRLLVVLAVAPVAVLTNSARVVASGLLAEHLGKWVLEGAVHDALGWAVFMAAFGLLFLLTLLLGRWFGPARKKETA